MDHNEFFREATLGICGNLEIEESLLILIRLLKKVMPVTDVFLQTFDSDFTAIRSIAHATLDECRKMDLLSPIAKNSGSVAGSDLPEEDATLVTNPAEFPVTRDIGKLYGHHATSVIIMFLRSSSEFLGFFVLISEDQNAFTEDQLEWVTMLKEPLVIAMSNALQHRQVMKLNDLLTDDNRFLRGELRRIFGDEIIGANFGLRDVMFKVRQVAALDSPVLLLGETGVGKDVIANTIHYSSSRSKGPFISVNCGAIPDNLIDSELFGHEKGAFTGALAQKRGRFERANKGTIFLDEIGELPLPAQVRLLRVLQNREIERVGGVDTIPLDIRIIAATNRNLEEMIERGEFREDLWFRLNVFPILIPSLRDRESDIPALIQHFIDQKSRELKLPSIPKLRGDTMDVLMDYHWPGNVRELQNIIERALILNPTGPIEPDNLGINRKEQVLQPGEKEGNSYDLDEMTARHIRKVLSITGGKINGKDGAAALLGINPNTLRNRMIKLGIDYGKPKFSVSNTEDKIQS